MTSKKCTKKRNARAKLLFCQSKPIAFLPFSLPSSLVKLPKEASNAAEIETVVAVIPGGVGGGALGYFLGGYVLPGTPNWHPVLKRKFP